MTDTRSAASALSSTVRAFLAEPRFATIATVGEDGSPHQAVVWYLLDDEGIVINSAVGRRWPADLVRDGRISVAVSDGTDGYRWVGLDGHVTVLTDQPTAQADIAAMARRYHTDRPDHAEAEIRRFQTQVRISFRVRVNAVHDHLD